MFYNIFTNFVFSDLKKKTFSLNAFRGYAVYSIECPTDLV